MPPELSTFLFEAANLLVLVGVLAWLFFRPVQAAIERRRVAIKQQTDDAQQKLAEADQLQREIKQRFAEMDQEMELLRQKTNAAAEAQAQQIVNSARETARREAEAASRRLAHLERSQQERLARLVAQTTGDSIGRLLRQIDQPGLERALVAAACREIEAFDGNSLAPVRVESAHPLDQTDHDALINSLGEAGETAEFHVIEDLGAGLRVATSCGLVDASAAGLSKFAERLLARQLADNGPLSTTESTDG